MQKNKKNTSSGKSSVNQLRKERTTKSNVIDIPAIVLPKGSGGCRMKKSSTRHKALFLLVLILEHTFLSSILATTPLVHAPYPSKTLAVKHSIPIVGKIVQDIVSKETQRLEKKKSLADIQQIAMPLEPEQGGPGTPEVQSFTPASVENLVDPFTGDFTYNINLMDVGGYPINLTYRSGISLNEEASWVGLGWNINPGSINRQVRGLPDDFKGEEIIQNRNQKTNKTIAVSAGLGFQIFGFETKGGGGSGNISGKLGLRIGGEFNTFNGWSISAGVHPGITGGASKGSNRLSGSLNLGAGIDSRKGGYLSVDHEGSMSANKSTFGAGLGISVSSREGLKSIGFKASYDQKWRKNISIRHGGRIDFARPTFAPSFEMPKRSVSRAFSATLGGEVYGLHISGSLSGSYAFEELAIKQQGKSAYGYLYTQQAPADALTDINREKDGVFRIENPVLHVTNFTYDLYQVNGQGINGMFRPMRGDNGILSDPTFRNDGKIDDYEKLFKPASPTDLSEGEVSYGVEIGLGNLTHFGVDVTQQSTTESQGKWENGNALNDSINFKAPDPALPKMEPVFFKNFGETTVLENHEKFELLGGFEAKAPELSPEEGKCENNLPGLGSLSAKREPRNTSVSWLTNEEMKLGRLPIRHTVTGSSSDYRRPYHIGVMNVTRDDGTRYEFGLPAYNAKQIETSFSVRHPNPKPDNGLVTYSADENSDSNSSGKSNYFDKKEIPPYAYAYLLTGLYSSDYVDVANDGPSADDWGTYTSFSYTQAHQNYKWRNPVEENTAAFQDNLKTDGEDDMASFTYGEKEVWYLYSIKTRNYEAIFYISDREDGLGVVGENGGKDVTKRLKKLDRIELYAVASKDHHGIPVNPLQTVYFEYDYSLCEGVNNHVGQGGKLTLKRVYSTYGTSQKGKETSYYFEYQNNPRWRTQDFDRWGNYKLDTGGVQNNQDFPYTPQDKTIADNYASAWHLSAIQTPGGGVLKIKYEADDYALVQNKEASVMTKILGFSKTKDSAYTDTLFTVSNSLLPNPINEPFVDLINNINGHYAQNNLYLFFELTRPSPSVNIYQYVKNIEHLFFNINTRVNPAESNFEYFQGFIPVSYLEKDEGDTFGRLNDSIGWLLLPGDVGGNHPISQACWMQIMKTNPQAIYNKKPLSESQTEDFFAAVEEFGKQIGVLGQDFKKIARSNVYCSYLDSNNLGYIRLNQVVGQKFGGGSRVKEVTIEDRWGALMQGDLNNLNFDYGQVYEYQDEFGQSSGVAQWEPQIGADENPWMIPINFPTKESEFASPVDQYITNPVGESFFPAPSVGYSRVIVRNKNRPGVTQHAAGYAVQTFYTAKDFPTISSYTPIQVRRSEVYLPFMVYTKRDNKATAAQGFVVELNNMHGQPKSSEQYSANGALISSINYEYFTNPDGKLKNDRLPVINPTTGEIGLRYMGIDYDFIIDAREAKSYTKANGINLNIEGFMAGPIPIYVPVPYPNIMEGESSLRTITYTKVIHRKGILKGVRVFQNGASLYTENLAFDGLTGQALVSAIPDEFGQLQYTTVLPAHWNKAYENMGPAYVNAESRLGNIAIANGSVNNIPSGWFRQGDQWLLFPVKNNLEQQINAVRAWVYRVDNGNTTLINEAGGPISGNFAKAVLALSGNRNMQSLQMASYLSQQNPIISNRIQIPTNGIIDASVQTFSDFWHTYQTFNPELSRIVCGLCEPNTNHPGYYPMIELIKSLGTSGKLDNLHERAVSSMRWPNRQYIGTPDGSVLRGSIVNTVTTETCGFDFYSPTGMPLPDSICLSYTPPLECFSKDELIFLPVNNDSCNFDYRKQEFRLRTDCFPLKTCVQNVTRIASPTCIGLGGGTLNPFFNGILGIWRPLATYRFVADRDTSAWQGSDGLVNGFRDFWQWSSDGIVQSPDALTYWQRADSAAVFSPYGHLLEMQNALQQPSATLYGYGYSFPIATASNARYHDIGCINFEDFIHPYSSAGPMTATGACLLPPHWTINPNDIGKVKNTVSHTGMYSMQLVPNSVVTFDRKIYPLDSWGRNRANRVVGTTFMSNSSDLIKPFSPATRKVYIANAWVRGSTLGSKPLFIVVDNTRYEFQRIGPMIEGWQQFQVEFTLAADAKNIRMELRSDANELWFDDLRIHPFDASMESYVYDPVSLRLMAKMDASNYATFYEYDKEGNLARTKKETERGIVTLQEVRSGKAKVGNQIDNN